MEVAHPIGAFFDEQIVDLAADDHVAAGRGQLAGGHVGDCLIAGIDTGGGDAGPAGDAQATGHLHIVGQAEGQVGAAAPDLDIAVTAEVDRAAGGDIFFRPPFRADTPAGACGRLDVGDLRLIVPDTPS